MSKQTRLFTLANLERVVFRPLFVFFTFSLVLLAIFQASGRFTMQVLPLFEDEINTLLSTQKMNAREIQGAWRGLNPVIKIGALSFPAGNVVGVEAELDLLESMFRSDWVAAKVTVDSVDLHVEQGAHGWALRGMPAGENQFDVTTALSHSDELGGLVRVHLHAEQAERAEIVQVQMRILNHSSMHHLQAQLANLAFPEQSLDVELWQLEGPAGLHTRANAGKVSGTFTLPKALSAMSNMSVSFADSHYADLDQTGGGWLGVELTGISLPNNPDIFAVSLALNTQRQGDEVKAVTESVKIASGAQSLQFEPFYMRFAIPEQTSQLTAAAELLRTPELQPMWSLWASRVEVGQAVSFFAQHLPGIDAAHNWLNALSLQADARNVHVYADPDLGMGYMASLTDVSMQGYKGAPTISNVEVRLWGYPRGVAMQASGRDSFMAFPDLYHSGWDLESVGGVVKAWFGNGYFGMRGSHLRASFDGSQVAGGFAITRPQEKYEQRLSLQIYADQVGLLKAKTFVPFNVPATLAQWLERGPRAGLMSNAQFAMHGQVHLRKNERGRRLELLTDLSGGEVEYDPRWPLVSAVQGKVHVAGVNTHIRVDRGISGGVTLQDSMVTLHDNSHHASGQVTAEGDASTLLEFVRTSPLKESLSFITPAWQGGGNVRLQGDLVIPINQEKPAKLAVDLDFAVEQLSLSMPEYRIIAQSLDGAGKFSLPHHFTGTFEGKLFGEPAQIVARHDPQWLSFDITGTARPKDVYTLLDTEQTVPIAGQFDFSSSLNLAMDGGITNLSLATDLQGLEVDLPAEFAKTAAMQTPSEIDVQFLSEYQSVRWRYQDSSGWLHYGDGIERGAVGVRTAPPMTAQDERAIVISGNMPRLVLSDWVSDEGESAVALPLDWVIQNLTLDEFVIDELSFADLKVNGAQRGQQIHFEVAGEQLEGRVTLAEDSALDLALKRLRLPDPSQDLEGHIGVPAEDPISVAVGQSLPEATVFIESLEIGDEPFGAWTFEIKPTEKEVVFEPFSTDVNGVHIKDGRMTWDLVEDQSSFSGRIRLDDLGETLPKWDYAPSLSTSRANVTADVVWTGSPLNVGLLNTSGQLTFNAKDGRFNEVESSGGGLRILSLMNFSKVAKRISLDFSDVVGEGLSFDKIEAQIGLASGELTFPERMLVDSSAGKFQVGGRVDLQSGELDNEMIVTLPVSKSLPWYGVYLALANPLVGIGVVVGERVLRKPIEQFSTAKFSVTGTLDDPKVDFVSLWDQSMKKTEAEPPVDEVDTKEPTAHLDLGQNSLAGEPRQLESSP